ncbi:MAG: FtsH protease activity modulator HflK [Woeseiaceae bacterium]|nr:FtsH protease activity modulator HflK [Woeseiaceae bacterium]
MAWNEPGNGKDPWNRDGGQPNDLDKIVQDWQRRFGGLFGGGKSQNNAGGGIILIVLLLVAWAFTGFYRVDEAERGVVQRFGAYTKTTMPGLHWHLPFPIEVVDIVNANAVQNYQFKTDMLTADQQYVSIQMVVQYRRADVFDFSFKVLDPDATLRDVTESALREVVGTSTLESLVTGERDQIAARTRDTLQATLDQYETGISLTSISIINLDYPEPVQAAVNDTQKASNDSDRFKLEAERYANNIIPRARGEAARIIEDARAYEDRVTRDAEGQASRFTALLEEYEKAPRVTRDRLYIEAIEDVYRRSNKVILDSDGSGNLMYLPIDKILEQQGRRSPGTELTGSLEPSTTFEENTRTDSRDTSRERRTR